MTAKHPRLAGFIVNGADYFVARLDNGAIRVGLRNCTSYDFPADIGHRFHDMAAGLETEDQAEEMHDMLTGIYCGEAWA